MYIHLKDSTIKVTEVVAVTKTIIPATNFTPKYFAMCVYVKGIEPIVHTYETEDERDTIFESVRDILSASETGHEITN
jgi:hypothetical protein